MTKTLDDAEDMAARGYKIFPLAERNKVPLKDYRWRDEIAPPLEERDSAWNYAIDCGQSGLVVIDLDVPGGESSFARVSNGETVPDTFTVCTPRGGRHLYFRGNMRGGKSGMLAKNIDVKGMGGYVVGPSSVVDERAYPKDPAAAKTVKGGKPYQITVDVPVAKLPDWLAGLILSKLAQSDYGKGWAAKSLDDLAAELADAGEGERNDCLNRVAFVAFANPRIDDDDARECLTDVALGGGLRAAEVLATIDSACRAATRERDS